MILKSVPHTHHRNRLMRQWHGLWAHFLHVHVPVDVWMFVNGMFAYMYVHMHRSASSKQVSMSVHKLVQPRPYEHLMYVHARLHAGTCHYMCINHIHAAGTWNVSCSSPHSHIAVQLIIMFCLSLHTRRYVTRLCAVCFHKHRWQPCKIGQQLSDLMMMCSVRRSEQNGHTHTDTCASMRSLVQACETRKCMSTWFCKIIDMHTGNTS